MSKNIKTKTCPICKNIAEDGFLNGNANPNSFVDNGLVWFSGKPNFIKNLFPFLSEGEPIGEWEMDKGTTIKGLRCHHCNKIILDL